MNVQRALDELHRSTSVSRPQRQTAEQADVLPALPGHGSNPAQQPTQREDQANHHQQPQRQLAQLTGKRGAADIAGSGRRRLTGLRQQRQWQPCGQEE